MDNVIMSTRTREVHIVEVSQMYKKLRQEHILAAPDKCTWGQFEVEYRGFILGKDGIMTQPQPQSQNLAIRHWHTSQNVSSIHNVHGLCDFYQIFVADYATVATNGPQKENNIIDMGPSPIKRF